MAVRGTAGDSGRWELSHRWLTGQIDRATHRTILAWQATPDFKFGVEWNPLVGEAGVVANWRIVRETVRRPAIIAGTSSDRIGTPSGQAWFVTASKGFEITPQVGIAPYVGMSWSGAEDRMLYPFGINTSVGDRSSIMFLYDGVHSHLTASRALGRWVVTGLLVEMSDPGLAVGVRF